MKKGFTLVELLIVMVIVALLVTLAVPKYKLAMERGRGQEGLANAAAISDALNAYYILQGNTYGAATGDAAAKYALGDSTTNRPAAAGVLLNKFFTAAVSASGTTKRTVTLSRSVTNNAYQIVFVNENGKISERYCSGYEKHCKMLGAVTTRASGGWSF